MSSDAIAVIRRAGAVKLQDWHEAQGVSGGTFVVRHLAGGTLVNLGLAAQSGDADLYAAVRRFQVRLPKRIWVFPDAVMPDRIESVDGLIALTKAVGRFIEAGPTAPSFLATLGLSSHAIEAFQRAMSSGSPLRIEQALEELRVQLKDHDPQQVERLLGEFLKGNA